MFTLKLLLTRDQVPENLQIFKKCKSDYVTPLLKTLERLTTAYKGQLFIKWASASLI